MTADGVSPALLTVSVPLAGDGAFQGSLLPKIPCSHCVDMLVPVYGAAGEENWGGVPHPMRTIIFTDEKNYDNRGQYPVTNCP